MIDVLLIEDHVLIRCGMRLMLEQIKGIRIVGEASTGEQGLILRRDKEPNVVILDYRLPDTNGFKLAKKFLRQDPDVKILVVTAMENELLPVQLLEAGVRGFITKSSDSNELEYAIRAVNSGQRYISSVVASQLALRKSTAALPFDNLSNRQMEVLLLLSKGMKTEEIAKKLHISTKTVNSHRYRMFEKLNVGNNIELIKLALQYGVIEIENHR